MRVRGLVVVTLSFAAVSVAGCSFVVDGALRDRLDAAVEGDAGPPATACTGRPNGTFCDIEGLTDREICLNDVCVVSACGDTFADTRAGHPSMIPPVEQCDDGNPADGDGCDFDCTFSCETVADCPDDTETCNGVPTCGPEHACSAVSEANDTTCTVVGSATAGTCRDGVCRAGMCGGPVPMIDPGEDCDDGNTRDGDGCDTDCTFSCTDDSNCQNDTACDGSETCDAVAHTCSPGAPPVCDDADPCTTDSCDPASGCVAPSVLVDSDMDGHFATTASCGGDDCNDMNAAVNPSAVEGCGATMDLNCDGAVSSSPRWYADCDRDGYAGSGAASVMACVVPTTVASGCSSVGWTALAPTSGATDCAPTNPSARPGQTGWFSTAATGSSYDYNCNGATEREFPTDPTFVLSCAFDRSGVCGGSTYWSETSVPSCGTAATQSYCTITIGFPTNFCSRRTRETTVRCH